MNKRCSRCRRRPAVEGQSWCQRCRTTYQRERRRAKRAEVIAYQREYGAANREKLAALQQRRRATPEGAARHRAGVRASEQKNPAAQQARRVVYRELRAGRLVRPSRCERCGKPCKPHAHHSNYAKPLEVQWLCAACHGEEHQIATHDAQ